MRIKRLEIQGFKSFKDKTMIHFDHHITGIVGPNGCGKSNIVDAFFWVMGEQSYKHMRGSQSEDLIFNGSSRYSPLGMAEATLVMEVPSDYGTTPAGVGASSKELSVTRRLYRSGEGEYFINGTLSRLKDIQELFMDTGVGAKGYSVIEQGQIGKVVNAKPEERRILIEEAAGIAKYKARKKESLRKMEATQVNLTRLTDMLQEIEKNLASLDRQAQKARQYQKYKDELFQKEVEWGQRKSLGLQKKLKTLQMQQVHLDQELLGLRTELQVLENQIQTDRIQLVTETQLSDSFQSQIQRFSDQLSHEKSALDLSRHRQEDLTEQLQSLNNEKVELQTSIMSDTQHVMELHTQIQEAEQVFQDVEFQMKHRSEGLGQLQHEVEQLRLQANQNQMNRMRDLEKISKWTAKKAVLLNQMESATLQVAKFSQQTVDQKEKRMALLKSWKH